MDTQTLRITINGLMPPRRANLIIRFHASRKRWEHKRTAHNRRKMMSAARVLAKYENRYWKKLNLAIDSALKS